MFRADPAPAPVLCVVTDRRRAYAGSDHAGAIRALAAQARWAAEAGVDLLQVRERDLDAALLQALVGAIRAAVEGTALRVIVNERLDVALAAGADGVHLRGDSLPPAAARSLAPAGFLIGRSVHAAAEARGAAAGADYLVAGTVFATPSKPGRTELLGPDGLASIAATAGRPVLAIGGITIERAAVVARAGAAGIAAIGLFLGPDGPCPLRDIVAAVRGGFRAGLQLDR
jgi:thiamine-phosphate diphosphorylase